MQDPTPGEFHELPGDNTKQSLPETVQEVQAHPRTSFLLLITIYLVIMGAQSLCLYAMLQARPYKAIPGLSGVCSKRGFCRANSHAPVPVSILGRKGL